MLIYELPFSGVGVISLTMLRICNYPLSFGGRDCCLSRGVATVATRGVKKKKKIQTKSVYFYPAMRLSERYVTHRTGSTACYLRL